MSLAELLPSVKALPKAEKIRLAQLLIADLAGENITEEMEFPVWTPLDTDEAAEIMLKALNESRSTR